MKQEGIRPDTAKLEDLGSYDKILVQFSGGKDSLACLLHILDSGADPAKIELWHQCVDGAPEGDHFIDWPITPAYCKALAEALNITIRFQWKEGGFLREMLRENELTQPVTFEDSTGKRRTVGGKAGKQSTRRLFPQVSGDLKVRWCSAYLKIDVASRAISNDESLRGKKILFVTGERREESSNRARYATVEKHKTSNRVRTVTQWRPVIDWDEAKVWDIIKRHKITPHPAYLLGWGRVSCAGCIFGNPDQWRSFKSIAPDMFSKMSGYEKEFDHTIHRTKSIEELSERGTDITADKPAELKTLAMGKIYRADQVFSDSWEIPAGAFKACGGPT